MSTTFGQFEGVVIPQTGFTPRQDTSGGWTASREYRMSRSTFDVNTIGTFSRGVKITAFDETVESYWSFLEIESKEVVYEEADHVVVRINFSGAAFGQYESADLGDDALPSYNLSGLLTSVSFSGVNVCVFHIGVFLCRSLSMVSIPR